MGESTISADLCETGGEAAASRRTDWNAVIWICCEQSAPSCARMQAAGFSPQSQRPDSSPLVSDSAAGSQHHVCAPRMRRRAFSPSAHP